MSQKKNLNIRKVAFVNGTRADFGLMLPILNGIKKNKRLRLQTYVTGMHLMTQHGKTIDYVKKYFPNVKVLSLIFKDDSQKSIATYLGTLINLITVEFSKDRPDITLVVGDRIEMLATALSSLYLGIPVAHVHGGDKSGTVDDSARHAITKIAHLHFPATKISYKRIKQMGEEKWRIKIVGAPSIETITKMKLPTREELFKKLKISDKEKIILITQHPVSEEIDQSEKQMRLTLEAAKSFPYLKIVILPNADAGNKKMIDQILKEKNNSLFRIYPNIDYHTFLALEREASVWVGNSSAGVIDSTTLKTPVVNVGTRQSGRLHGKNVIDVDYNLNQIKQAMEKCLYDKKFKLSLKKFKNPWGAGKTSEKVIKVISQIKIDNKLIMKKFI
jgi:GDP/UDP-N,N'-diacetylbacillosamine 2-epimerase (hydrolysing)